MINGTDDLFTDAPCRDEDPEIMFPWAEPGTGAYEQQVDEARAVCAGCPVRAGCLDYVLRTEDPQRPYGVWAGTTTEQRTELRRAKRAAGIPVPTPVASATRGEQRPPRTDPSPGQARALLTAHHLGGHVPATVSGSTSRMLVDDGLAERRDGRTTPGRRRGHYTRLTAAGLVLAARLAAEQETTQGWDVEPVRSTA